MTIAIVLLRDEQIFHTTMEEGTEISFGSHKKDQIFMADFIPEQIKLKWKKSGVYINAKKAYGFEQQNAPLDRLIMLHKETKTALYLSSITSQNEERIKLPYDCILKFGRSDKNDVVIKLPYVSNVHFVLKNEAGSVRIEDLGSTNGIYLNGKKVNIAHMKSGDVLSIWSTQICLQNGELFFRNVGEALSINEVQDYSSAVTSHMKGQGTALKYRRSPRMQEQLPCEDIILSNAPTKGQKFEKSGGMFSALAGTGAMFAASMLTTAASPALLAARAASLVSPVTSFATSSSSNKKRKKNMEQYEAMRWEKYGAYINDQRVRIESVAKVQRDILTRENQTPQECINTLYELKRSLWERMPSDRDFLDVRIGMGYEELCVKVKSRQDGNQFQMEDDEVRELSEQIIEQTRIVDNIPARISLLENQTIGMVGNRHKAIQLVKNMLIALTSTHCFEDIRIVGIFNQEEREIWDSLRWFPHTWDENQQFRFLAFDKKEAHNLCDFFHEVLKGRREEVKENYYHKTMVPKPYYIFLFGSKELVEKEEIMNELFVDNIAMGATSIFLFNDMYSLPHGCKFIVDLDNGPCAFDKNVANKKFYFTMDAPTQDAQFDAYARRMSAIELDGFSTQADLPNGTTFLQGFEAETVEQLHVIERWNSSVAYESLAAPIGMMAGGKRFSLDIHEKKHGPHGLVAGTTGSGKSELLQTWILSMALCYHPHDVVFVLIDYKGGGMANLLEPLPHVVGKITNIGSNIGRSLISLQSEIKRRMAVFDAYNVNHIDKYQKLYKSGKAVEPLPHLIIVADEFAELKKEEPEFMTGLISASRVGRSLGVHLVLATQKPGGVVDDQIQSNSRFRLCLKVQDVNDSREMIKRPDAAKITQAGRSYIRVGEDEYFDLFQSYWSGAPYFGHAKQEDDEENCVRIVEISGRRIKMLEDNRPKMKSDLDELTAIVRYMKSVAKENGIKKLPGPWAPELPEELMHENLPCEGGFDGKQWKGNQKWLTIPVGLFDSPKTQSQGVQIMDFATEGHYGIYGAPGTGKTTLLKTVVLALGKYYTPQDVNIYILDCGGWSMSVFANMPHVGGVALDGEEEKFFKFEKLIMDEFENRKRQFLKNEVSSLTAYREAVSADMPAIIIAIDNFVPIFDLYPDLENLFTTIAREGATYGIHLVYTANTTSGVRYKVLQNIRGAVAFELTDKGDYTTIVGRIEGMPLPKVCGRAFFKGNPPMEFQAALYMDGETDRDKMLKLKNLIAEMNQAWDGPKPRPIPVMPETVTLSEMMQEYNVRTVLPVGVNYEDIRTTYMDLTDNYSMMISGSMHSGKSRMLQNMSDMILTRFSETKVFVFDSSAGALQALKASAYKYAQSNDDMQVTAMLEELVEFLNVRKRAQNQARQVEGDSFDEKEFITNYEMLCIVIDDLKEFVDDVSDMNKNSMERICRLAQNLGVIVLSAGRMSDISKYNEIESLTRVIVGNQIGLTVSGTPAQYGFFQNNLKYNERDLEAGEGNGYVYVNGKCSKIKLIQ